MDVLSITSETKQYIDFLLSLKNRRSLIGITDAKCKKDVSPKGNRRNALLRTFCRETSKKSWACHRKLNDRYSYYKLIMDTYLKK